MINIIPDEPIFDIDPNAFYQTPNSMTIKAINANLTGADWKLWAYLQATDPHGERMKTLKVEEIIKAIKMSIRQFKRSLKKLEELGFYYAEPVEIRGQNLAGKLVKEICQRKKESKFSSHNKMTDLPTGGQDCRIDARTAESMPNLPTGGQDCLNQPLEPLQAKDSETTHTIQTYSDFKHTLSDFSKLEKNEREKFEKFVREEWRKLTARNGELGQEIVSIERFLSKPEDFINWYERFKSSAAGRNAVQETANAKANWHSKPYFEEWVRQAFHRGYEWVNEDPREQKERLAFFTWADKANPYIGICYELPT